MLKATKDSVSKLAIGQHAYITYVYVYVASTLLAVKFGSVLKTLSAGNYWSSACR